MRRHRTEITAPIVQKCIGNLSRDVAPRTVTVIQLHAVLGRTVSIRKNPFSVSSVDRAPIYRRRILHRSGRRRVVIGQNLHLAVNQPHSADPFPNVAVQIPDAVRTAVMAPRERSRPRRYAADLLFLVTVGNPRDLLGFTDVLSHAVIAQRQTPVLSAPQRDRAPFHSGHQMKAIALDTASLYRRVKAE